MRPVQRTLKGPTMATRDLERSALPPLAAHAPPNGAALAAFLAAGIGSAAMGLFALFNEMGIFSPPTLYAPAGGVSGRTTFAVVLWLLAWVVLHASWRERQLSAGAVGAAALLLVGLGILGTFPPFWEVMS